VVVALTITNADEDDPDGVVFNNRSSRSSIWAGETRFSDEGRGEVRLVTDGLMMNFAEGLEGDETASSNANDKFLTLDIVREK
jgi:hypothetical protein